MPEGLSTHKRKTTESLSNDTSDESVSDTDSGGKKKHKRKRTTEKKSKRKVGLRRLDADRQRLVKDAITWFQSLCIHGKPWLSGKALDLVAVQAWNKAVVHNGLALPFPPTAGEINLVCCDLCRFVLLTYIHKILARLVHHRGEIIGIVKLLTNDSNNPIWQLANSDDASIVKRNRELIARLTDKYAFTFQVSSIIL